MRRQAQRPAASSPNKVTSQEIRVLTGDPDPELITTSYIERHNLSMRMTMRRFTRLTNASSKKAENHVAAMWQNFGRPHKSIANVPSHPNGSGYRGRHLDLRGIAAPLD